MRSRSQCWIAGIAVWLAAAVATADGQTNAASERVHLVILHINDTHGSLGAVVRNGRPEAGIGRLATLVAHVRAENPGRVLLLHAGDILSRGDALTIHSGGELTFRLMDGLGFDALTPGNGDFYFGLDNLLRLSRLVRFPLLHANTTLAGTNTAPFAPFVTRTVAGIRTAIVGVGRLSLDHPASRRLEFHDPVDAASRWAAQLRPQCDLLIALTHIGVPQDLLLAAAAPGFDLIVGGDTHTRLDAPMRIPRPAATGETAIVQAGSGGLFLGRVDVSLLKIGDTASVRRVDARLLRLDDSVAEAPDTVATLAAEKATLGEALTTLDAPLPNPASGRSPMGEFAAEAIRSAAGADAAFLDRAAVASGLRAGKVTLADVYRVHPWRNRTLVVNASGEQIGAWVGGLNALTAGCGYRRDDGLPGRLEIQGSNAVPDRVYSVAVGEYLFLTTPVLRGLPARDAGFRVDEALAASLRELGSASVERGGAPAPPPGGDSRPLPPIRQ